MFLCKHLHKKQIIRQTIRELLDKSLENVEQLIKETGCDYKDQLLFTTAKTNMKKRSLRRNKFTVVFIISQSV